MTLHEWIAAKGAGEISRLVRETGCAGTTFHDVLNGHALKRYDIAKKISDATGGKVSVADLCEQAIVEQSAREHGRLRDPLPREHNEGLPRHASAGEG